MKLLQTFAQVRFNSNSITSKRRSRASQDSISTPPGLESLSIYCPESRWTHLTWCALNGWKAPQHLSPVVEEANKRITEILTRFNIPQSYSDLSLTKAEVKEIESDLRCIYEYDGFTLSDLMFTNLPDTITRICAEQYAFDYRDLATRILEKWAHILRQASGPDRWRTPTDNWIHYGSTNAETREVFRSPRLWPSHREFHLVPSLT
ncbi:hypothetical protein CPC08DRAFT_767617 [Agrocybe pediades]|nr:hypothetical protein CPC08DRAFT_767617 [Agrocybe pediades]